MVKAAVRMGKGKGKTRNEAKVDCIDGNSMINFVLKSNK